MNTCQNGTIEPYLKLSNSSSYLFYSPKVLSAIESGPISFDVIVEAAGLEAGTVSSILLQLELLGLVSQLPGMRYQRC